MILFTIIFLITIRNIQMQPVTCLADIHCSVGFFCHTITHSCHECLSCEHLRRLPDPNNNSCIKSAYQCGPCFQGLINDDDNYWGAMCLSQEGKRIRMLSSYIYIFLTCAAAGVFLPVSLFIVHGIWNTNIIKVKIATIPSCKKISSPSSDDTKFTKKVPIVFKV